MPVKPSIFSIIKTTVQEWLAANGPRLGAALAFYSALSIGPLLVIVLAVGGLLFSQKILSGHLIHEMNGLIGQDGAGVVSTIIERSQQPSEGIIASLLSLSVLLVAASGVFGELQDAMNTIWKVQPREGAPYWQLLRSRFFSFAMVLGTGFLLLISLVITSTLHMMSDYIDVHFHGLSYMMLWVNWLVSFAVSTALFGLIFRQVPDMHVRWRDVWPGAMLTALLFDIGKMLIGIYLGHSAIRTTYGAAGSFVVFLAWIYYSAQILYFGAAFTRVWAEKRGVIPD